MPPSEKIREIAGKCEQILQEIKLLKELNPVTNALMKHSEKVVWSKKVLQENKLSWKHEMMNEIHFLRCFCLLYANAELNFLKHFLMQKRQGRTLQTRGHLQ